MKCPDPSTWERVEEEREDSLSEEILAHLDRCTECALEFRSLREIRDLYPESRRRAGQILSGEEMAASSGGGGLRGGRVREVLGKYGVSGVRKGSGLHLSIFTERKVESGDLTPSVRPSAGWSAAAAAVLLAAGIGTWGVDRVLSEPDVHWRQNVSVDAAPQSRWEWDGKGGGILHFHDGTVELDVPSGVDGLTVRTVAGDVKVLGTRFSVRGIDVPPPAAGEASEKAVVVELFEGAVELENRLGSKRLFPSQFGILVPGKPPFRTEKRSTPPSSMELRTLWDDLIDAYERGDRRQAALLAALLSTHGESPAEIARRIREGKTDETK